MRRQKTYGNHSPPPQNSLIQDSEGNEENGYPEQIPRKQR
jgi:hypothetical protein